MQINYPPSINTDRKKIAFIFRVIEVLRLGHNFMGYWFKTGFTSETQFNNALNNQIPAPAKNWILNHYTYKPKLTEAEWKDFLQVKFENREKWILHFRNIVMQKFFDNTAGDSVVDLDGVLT